MNWYLTALQNYADFDGRARRREYWFFVLFNFLIAIGLECFAVLFHQSGVSVLGALYSLAVLIPSIAVSVRRLHDTSRRGWWLLIGVVPILGAIVLLVFMVQDSQPGENAFGPNPKSAPAT